MDPKVVVLHRLSLNWWLLTVTAQQFVCGSLEERWPFQSTSSQLEVCQFRGEDARYKMLVTTAYKFNVDEGL